MKGLNPMDFVDFLFSNVFNITWQHVVMWCIGGILIYLAIAKKMEPTLLLPIGFGTILVNIPLTGVITQEYMHGDEIGVISLLFDSGIGNELFPLLLFIGIGAMIDFEPLLTNPKLFLFGAAAQFGIFFTLSMARLFGFDLHDAASISIIGAADGPTSIFVANTLNSNYIGAITVAAYSYMALVPIVQPPVIRLMTTKKERRIRMEYKPGTVSKQTKILFPIIITAVVSIVSYRSAALIGFLMFGNLLRECGVLFAKVLNLFVKKKVNPMIGAAGISAFPMSARIIQKMGQKEDPQNFLLMHAVGANVSGQIASVIAGGIILNLIH